MDTLEHELLTLLHDLRCSPRQARALSIRLGWDGAGGGTLADAAAATGYTRERVRQLEERVRARLMQAPPRLPLATRALDLVEALAPAPRAALAAQLASVGIAEAPFDPRGVLRTAELTGAAPRVVVEGALVVAAADVELLRGAAALAVRLVRRSGPVRLWAVATRLGADADAVRRLLDLGPRVLWLDVEREWFTLPSVRSRPAREVAKMLAVAGPLTLADLADGLRRGSTPLLVPRDLLRAWIAALPWLELDPERDLVSPRRPLDPERVLTPLERSLLAALRPHGPELRVTEAGRLAAEAGLNPTSAMLYVWRSPLFRTVARGRYALRLAA